MNERSNISLSKLEADINATLTAVSEIDRWYDLEREKLDLYPEAIRSRVAADIKQRHRLNRQPYVLHLAHLHQMIVSTRIFGDPGALARHQRVEPQRHHPAPSAPC